MTSQILCTLASNSLENRKHSLNRIKRNALNVLVNNCNKIALLCCGAAADAITMPLCFHKKLSICISLFLVVLIKIIIVAADGCGVCVKTCRRNEVTLRLK